LTLLPNPDYSSEGYDTYLLDAQQQLSIAKERCSDWKTDHRFQSFLDDTVDILDDEQCIEKFYGGGQFFTVLFDRLETMLHQSLETNLVLTGIFTKMCQYPIPVLYKFLLDIQAPVRPGIRTLWTVLCKIAEEVHQVSQTIPDYKEQIIKVKQKLQDPRYDFVLNRYLQGSSLPDVQTNANPQFLEAVVVLEEFCKELAATWQLWATHRDATEE
jgi:hypothetical protein